MSPTEDWQDLIDWDDVAALQGNTPFGGPQSDNLTADHYCSGSFSPVQPYLVPLPPSLEYTVSAPPSALSGSSYDHIYSTSPSVDMTATSPTMDQVNSHYFGSFDASDGEFQPLSYPQEPPVLDTRFDRIADSFDASTSTEAVFNPYVAGSSHSFSGLDLKASQILNAGTWADQPHVVEPIAEAEEWDARVTAAYTAPPHPQSFINSFTSYPRNESLGDSHSSAVPIPILAQSQRVPPALSVSPVAHRRHRSTTMSRSNSRADSRRKPGTPSPTSDGFGWVSYHINSQTNRLAPTSTEGLQGRTPRGRKKGLTAEQRSHAALMRIVGSCANCQRRKEKCDPGTPCRSCLEHYKGDLVNHPCRDRVLSDLSRGFLSERLGWHPTVRSLESFIAPNDYNISTGITYSIPMNFGFGPALLVPVHALHIEPTQTHIHEHIVYSWPPESASGSTHTHAVLLAVLTESAMLNLTQTLDTHLALLVTHHFRSFPLYCSPLRILREIYVFQRSLPPHSPHTHILHQALKLLVLVHIGGDMTLSPPSDNPALTQLIHSTTPTSRDDVDLAPTPCFIRAQFGSVMPRLALTLMQDVLASLEHLLLGRDCDDWPISLAVLITVLMTVESIHYHAAKLPYHNLINPRRPVDENVNVDDEGVRTLLAFYSACFSGCHVRLGPEWEGDAVRAGSPEDVFVESVREGVRSACCDGYLEQKAGGKREGDDIGFFFDRLVSRLLLLGC
jgi:hypothetical protein